MGSNRVMGYTCAGGRVHPTEQEKQIRAWASNHGHTTLWVGGDLGDLSNAPASRPGLVRLLHAIETLAGGDTSDLLIVFYDIERALPTAESRTVVLYALRTWPVHDLASGAAVDVDNDPLVRQLNVTLRLQRDLHMVVHDRILKTRAAQARRAHERVGEIPLGWCLAESDSTRLAPYEPEREAAQRAREMQREGKSLRCIGRELLAEGYMPRGKAWGHASVSRLLALAETLPRRTQTGESLFGGDTL